MMKAISIDGGIGSPLSKETALHPKPVVSVVIIFLNAEELIQDVIESIFAQTYDNRELLLVDDGSTDASTQTALRYTGQYPGKVRYLEHEGHQNRRRARNKKELCESQRA